jgi:hypothetical protein
MQEKKRHNKFKHESLGVAKTRRQQLKMEKKRENGGAVLESQFSRKKDKLE